MCLHFSEVFKGYLVQEPRKSASCWKKLATPFATGVDKVDYSSPNRHVLRFFVDFLTEKAREELGSPVTSLVLFVARVKGCSFRSFSCVKTYVFFSEKDDQRENKA